MHKTIFTYFFVPSAAVLWAQYVKVPIAPDSRSPWPPQRLWLPSAVHINTEMIIVLNYKIFMRLFLITYMIILLQKYLVSIHPHITVNCSLLGQQKPHVPPKRAPLFMIQAVVFQVYVTLYYYMSSRPLTSLAAWSINIKFLQHCTNLKFWDDLLEYFTFQVLLMHLMM